MNRIKTVLLSIMLFVFFLSGCSGSSEQSILFSVGTGDNIRVTLDTSDGLVLKQTESGYAVTSEGTEVIQSFFVEEAAYEQYVSAVREQAGVTVNEEKTAGGLNYICYSYSGEAGQENNVIGWIEGSSTGVVIASLSDLQTVQDALEHLSFTKEQ